MIRPLHILILEDNDYDIDLLLREFKKNELQFVARIAKNRKSFELGLTDPCPDIILSDYTLPAYDGWSAYALKQEICPDVPFIVVSGTLGEEKAVEMIKEGITDYALKSNLFTITPKILRALHEVEELREKRIINEELIHQNERLREIALLQSHQIRVPVAQILGLFDLFKFEQPAHPINAEILGMLKVIAESLDGVISEIVLKTSQLNIEQSITDQPSKPNQRTSLAHDGAVKAT